MSDTRKAMQTALAALERVLPQTRGAIVVQDVEYAIDRLTESLAVKPADAGAATTDVTRFEVIDHRDIDGGREFVAYDCSVELAYQDGGKTLKVFVNRRAALSRAQRGEP